jgi:DNA polymerase V
VKNSLHPQKNKQYIAIDLKSFYASVECMELGLDPLTTNLVVADVSRTEKTICLAVSPSLKAYGISGRARLFEVVQRVKEINANRLRQVGRFVGKSSNAVELANNPALEVDYIAAPPQMSHYMEVSAQIYRIYLKYIAPEDIHVYSIDEVFIDATNYLSAYGMTAHELAMTMMRDVLKETGITATAGVGTNLYLAKIAMDIMAKKAAPDADGVRIAELDEMSYRRQLWDHKPLTDFWRVGKGYAKKLHAAGLFTMGDVARCSIQNEDLLYQMFGVNAELLIDHAWGWEPCTIDLVKAYEPEDRSFSSGQVLMSPYDFDKARIIVQEMADAIALDLVEKRMVTDQIVLTINFEAFSKTNKAEDYQGEVATDWYGKKAPKHAHGTENLERYTSSGKLIMDAALRIYDRTVDPKLLIRRVTIVVNHVLTEEAAKKAEQSGTYEQMDLFTDYQALEKERRQQDEALTKERQLQEAMLSIKNKYGKNAILKGLNLQEGATGKQRNEQVGGHKA